MPCFAPSHASYADRNSLHTLTGALFVRRLIDLIFRRWEDHAENTRERCQVFGLKRHHGSHSVVKIIISIGEQLLCGLSNAKCMCEPNSEK